MDECKERRGFGTRFIALGEIEVVQVDHLEKVWESIDGRALFYKPDNWLLVARATTNAASNGGKPAPLAPPLDYTIVWRSPVRDDNDPGMGFWLPVAASGYRALGFVVSRSKPGLDEVVCVREDLTIGAIVSNSIWKSSTSTSSSSASSCPSRVQFLWSRLRKSRVTTDTTLEKFFVWQTRPRELGITAKGLSIGTFYCSTTSFFPLSAISTLQNVAFDFSSMPDKQQVDALVRRYAPTLFLHPDEAYFPSSVEWFFENGALLYSRENPSAPVRIQENGLNLPAGGTNDGSYWLDLPHETTVAQSVRKGNLDSAVTYLHVKPMHGGTFTDLQFWIYYPFNGPATLKVGFLNVKLGKIGEHVSDWEHLALRIDNFTGNLCRIYLGHHSCGTWYQPSDMEFDGSTYRPFVYSSKHGHAAYAHPGDHLQGDESRGLGIRNDTKKSSFTLDLNKYQLISAAYLGVEEPPWLQFMREWGPKIEYNTRSELDKVIKLLPTKIRRSIEEIFNKFPNELSGEEGPTGPKEKNFWLGDER